MRLTNQIVVSHTSFDKYAINYAFQKYNLPSLNCVWIDTAIVARSVWKEYSHRGYGLENLAEHFNIQFDHHTAVEDARVAGEILLLALKNSSLSLNDFIDRDINITLPRREKQEKYPRDICLSGNPDGPLYGETVVFTGELSMPREDIAAIAAKAGCNVDASVTHRTSILVVGIQDENKLAGNSKSSKYRRAEELITKGHSIKIMNERGFFCLINGDNGTESVFQKFWHGLIR